MRATLLRPRLASAFPVGARAPTAPRSSLRRAAVRPACAMQPSSMAAAAAAPVKDSTVRVW